MSEKLFLFKKAGAMLRRLSMSRAIKKVRPIPVLTAVTAMRLTVTVTKFINACT